jgi:hypothetical protein
MQRRERRNTAERWRWQEAELDDPRLERLKERQRRWRGARPGVLHTLSCLLLIGGAATLATGAFEPWLVLYGHGEAAISAGGGADEAMATLLVIVAAVDAGLAAFVLAVALMRRRARFIHGLSIVLSVLSFILLIDRIRIDEHQTLLARLDPDGAQSYLGSGMYLVCIGLAVCAAAPLVALPEIRRALKT